MKKTSFAYIQNIRIPSQYAHSLYVTKVCEAAARLNYHTTLLLPQATSLIDYQTIASHYNLKPPTFTVTTFSVPNFTKLTPFFEKIYYRFRHLFISWIFSCKSLNYLIANKVQIVQTSQRELIFLLRISRPWYEPKIIYDVHIKPVHWYEAVLEKWIISRVDLFLVTSPYLKKYFNNQGIEEIRIVSLPNGFDPKYYPKTFSKTEIRKKLNLPIDRFIIGYIGRFETMGVEKGVGTLIHAAAKLHKRIPITIVAVGGPDHLSEKYKKLASNIGFKADEFIVRPQVKPEEVAAYIHSFDVGSLLYPDTFHYRFTMSPMKAIEYMAGKTAIIASDFESLTAILPAQDAHFVDPINTAKIRQIIENIYFHPSTVQTQAEHQYRYVQQFSWVERVKKTIQQLK